MSLFSVSLSIQHLQNDLLNKWDGKLFFFFVFLCVLNIYHHLIVFANKTNICLENKPFCGEINDKKKGISESSHLRGPWIRWCWMPVQASPSSDYGAPTRPINLANKDTLYVHHTLMLQRLPRPCFGTRRPILHLRLLCEPFVLWQDNQNMLDGFRLCAAGNWRGVTAWETGWQEGG